MVSGGYLKSETDISLCHQHYFGTDITDLNSEITADYQEFGQSQKAHRQVFPLKNTPGEP